jgi:hypothetical protein
MKFLNYKNTVIKYMTLASIGLQSVPHYAQAAEQQAQSVVKTGSTTVTVVVTSGFATEADKNANRERFEKPEGYTPGKKLLRINAREGVWTSFGEPGLDLQELLDQARDFKSVLETGKRKIEQFRLAERLNKYIELMSNVVVESKDRTSELLMRYALNRGMAVRELFSNERSKVKTAMSAEALNSLELQVLKDAVDRAILLYEKDEKFLDILKNTTASKNNNEEMKARFGFDLFEISKLEYENDYANYIIELAVNAPTHNGTFQLLKYIVFQMYNGINSSLLRNRSQKLRGILRNLYDLGMELPAEAPMDPLSALSLNNMTKDNLESIIKDFNDSVVMLKTEMKQIQAQSK